MVTFCQIVYLSFNKLLFLRAYKHIQAHGIPLERDYGRYLGINGVCKPNFTEKYYIKDWVNIPSGDLNALKVALFEEGPISVGIDASHPSFAFYNQGVNSFMPIWLIHLYLTK